MALNQEQIASIKKYILQREHGLDEALLSIGNPAGKDVLVFGCGLGNEILWCAKHHAKSVVGIDLGAIHNEPLRELLDERGVKDFNYSMNQWDVNDLAISHKGRYDLIISNGVFEHVMDMKGVFNSFRALLRPKGRIATYADGLWFSSIGGHLGLQNWEHLWMSNDEIKEKYPDRWKAFKGHLNRMTALDFMSALRDVGALVLQFKFRSDPHINKLPELIDKIREKQEISPTDLSVTSIGCEICFIEHL